jgi:8-oxo-dGTP pyrophosphatase MutT (NUDIX family)
MPGATDPCPPDRGRVAAGRDARLTMFHPDLVDVWVFRSAGPHEIEILLMRRSPGRVLAGLWQGVSGSLDGGERISAGALRELREETGFAGPAIEAFYDLDLVNQFHWSPADAIVSAAVFAVRVGGAAEPVLSHEHDAYRWRPPHEAHAMIVWPGYHDALTIVERDLVDQDREPWFRLEDDGTRVRG